MKIRVKYNYKYMYNNINVELNGVYLFYDMDKAIANELNNITNYCRACKIKSLIDDCEYMRETSEIGINYIYKSYIYDFTDDIHFEFSIRQIND